VAFDFPAAPTTGQVFNAPTGQGYVWNGTVWNLAQTSPQAPVASDVPPSSPYAGQLWFKSSTGALYMWYVDANSSQWVQIPGATVYTPPQAWELIGDLTLNAVAQQDVLNLGAFRKLRLSGAIVPSAAVGVALRVSSNNGVSFDSGATDYPMQNWFAAGATGTASSGTAATISLSVVVPNAGSLVIFNMLAENFNSPTTALRTLNHAQTDSSGVMTQAYSVTQRNAVGPRNAIRIFANGGGTLTGTVTIEGVRG
jgi:hypothetical protein